MRDLDTWVREIDENGFAFPTPRLKPSLVNEIEALLGTLSSVEGRRRGGHRGILDQPPVSRLIATAESLHDIVRCVLGNRASCVRGLLFDKNARANWKVPWHQDLTVAVRKKHEALPGFGPWSTKNGVPHVHAPVSVLERMVALRVHIDDCGDENGPLCVLPATHRRGELGRAEIDELARGGDPVTCTAARGDVLAMRPLLLHRSATAVRPGRRRVLHLEFAAEDLSAPLEWRWRVAFEKAKGGHGVDDACPPLEGTANG
jgi:hypothetical protein